MSEPGSAAFYANQRALGRLWLTDPLFQVSPLDIGPAVLAAITYGLQTNGNARIWIPRQVGGAEWIWATPLSINIQSITSHVGEISIESDGAVIRIALSDVTAPVLQTLNAAYGAAHMRGIIWTGNPSIGVDCAAIWTLGGILQSTLTQVQAWGVQCSSAVPGAGLFVMGTSSCRIEDLLLTGCSTLGTRSGQVVIAGSDVAEINNMRCPDFGSLLGVDYNKSNNTRGHIYCESVRNLTITTSSQDENVTAQVLLNAQNVGDIGHVTIRNGVLNQPNVAAHVLVQGQGCDSLTVEDTDGGQGHYFGTAFDLTNVLEFTLRRFKFGSRPNTLGAGVHTILSRTGNGHFHFIDCQGAYFLDTSRSAPVSVDETVAGVTTRYPCSYPNVEGWYRCDTSTISGAFAQGSGGAFTAVTATHHLDLFIDDFGNIAIPFTGAENNITAFINTINGFGNPYISASNVGGQLKILFIVQGTSLYSGGSVLNTTSADVLTSLGLTVGPVNNPATLSQWPDMSGLADATHTMSASGAPVFTRVDSHFGNQSSATLADPNFLVSPTWSSPVPQPYTVAIVMRQISASTVTALDGVTSTRAALTFVAGENALHLNSGADIPYPVADTTKAHLYIAKLNGTNSTLSIDADTPFAISNPGTNSLTGLALGLIGGGAHQGGLAVAEIIIIGRPTTYYEDQDIAKYVSRRYGIAMQTPQLAGDNSGPLNASITTGIQTTPVKAGQPAFNAVLLADAAITLPSGIAGLQGWWEADTNVGLSGPNVNNWTDQSANAYVLSAGNSPTYSATGGPNNLPQILISRAATEYIQNAGISPASPTTGQTVFIVHKFSSPAPPTMISAEVQQSLAFGITGTNDRAVLFGNTNYIQDVNNSITTNWEVWEYTCINGAQSFWVNGALIGTDTQTVSTGPGVAVGRSSTFSTYYFDGAFYALLIYNTVLSSSDRIKIRSYLQNKTGITIAGAIPPSEYAPKLLNGDITPDPSVAGKHQVTGLLLHSLPALPVFDGYLHYNGSWQFTAVSAGLPDPVTVAHGGTGDTSLTAHGVLIGEGTSAVAVTAVGATNQFLGGNTGADPTWQTVAYSQVSGTPPDPLTVVHGGTGLATLTPHALLVGAGTGNVTLVGPNATNGLPLLSLGSTSDPGFAALNLSGSGVTSTLGAPNGGTGVASPTAHSMPIAEGASAFTFVPAAAANKLWQAQGASADPAWSTWTQAAPGTSGHVLTSDGTNWASAAPATGVPDIQFSTTTGTTVPATNAVTQVGTQSITLPAGSTSIGVVISFSINNPDTGAAGAAQNITVGVNIDSSAAFAFSKHFTVPVNLGSDPSIGDATVVWQFTGLTAGSTHSVDALCASNTQAFTVAANIILTAGT